MKWFDTFLSKPILKILRIDEGKDYTPFQPAALFIMLDEMNGLLIGLINDQQSITIESATLSEVHDNYGIAFSENLLNELRPDDWLNGLINQTIKEIRGSTYDETHLVGSDFIIKEQKYKDVTIAFDRNRISFHNDHGGRLEVE